MQREQKQVNIKLALEEYINAPIEQKSLTKIGKKYDVKRQTLAKKLKEQGIEVINYQNIDKLDKYVFDIIDSEEKAYWLGFLWADGNISTIGYRIEVRLSIRDYNHLEKFRSFLKLENPIRKGLCNGNGYCHLSVRNKYLWERLFSLGCIPNKSLVLDFPNLGIFDSPKLVYDFIRGYVDGDGSLCMYKHRNTIETTLNLVGTSKFLSKVKTLFGELGYIKNKTSKNWPNKAYSLTYTSFIARVICRLLYENANIYLDRKYKIFLDYCRLEEGSSRRLSSKIGESCDANTEIISKITKGLEILQSVEGE